MIRMEAWMILMVPAMATTRLLSSVIASLVKVILLMLLSMKTTPKLVANMATT